jgi:hypothetical protein
VDGLHSIEKTADKVAQKFLTSKTEGVKTHSFFDMFRRVFLTGREAGTESSPLLQAPSGARPQRYYDGPERTAELKANNKAKRVEGKKESRGVERVFR